MLAIKDEYAEYDEQLKIRKSNGSKATELAATQFVGNLSRICCCNFTGDKKVVSMISMLQCRPRRYRTLSDMTVQAITLKKLMLQPRKTHAEIVLSYKVTTQKRPVFLFQIEVQRHIKTFLGEYGR